MWRRCSANVALSSEASIEQSWHWGKASLHSVRTLCSVLGHTVQAAVLFSFSSSAFPVNYLIFIEFFLSPSVRYILA